MHVVTKAKEPLEILAATMPHSRLIDPDYLATMCHEIATPLGAIIGLSRLLAKDTFSPEKKKLCFEMLIDSSNMLMGLMKNMLDASKIDAGMIELENVSFDLAKLVQETVHIITTQAQEKGVELHVHIANELPNQYMGDPLRIRQILLNLLSNAIKFTNKGNVTLYVNALKGNDGSDQLCITVADTGIGMNEVALQKIFRKYAQASSNVGREYGGTGLGLSISQELAHLMHGNISVKSWPGIGSHFIVTLPLLKATAFLAVA